MGRTVRWRCPKAVPAGENLGDAAAVAYPRVGLVAQQAARLVGGDYGGALQIEFGLGACEPLIYNGPKPLPLAPPVGKPSLGRRAERGEMDILDPGFLDCGRQLTLRKAWPSRDRPVAHIEQYPHPRIGQGCNDIAGQRPLVADRIEKVHLLPMSAGFPMSVFLPGIRALVCGVSSPRPTDCRGRNQRSASDRRLS